MSKSVRIDPNPRNRKRDDNALDAFVAGTPASRERMKRLTFDIDADLHLRIKLACVARREDMAVVIRRMLNEGFPAEARPKARA